MSKKFHRSWIARKLNSINRTARVFIPFGKRALVVIPFKTFSLVPLVLLIIASGYLLLRSDVFLVRQVEILREGGFVSEDISSAELLPDTLIQYAVEPHVVARSLWNIDMPKIREEVLAISPSVAEVVISRKLPDHITITVIEREPIALLAPIREETTFEGQHIAKIEYYLIDQDGEVYQKIPKKADLPTFVYPSLFEERSMEEELVGHTFDEDVIKQLVAVSNALQHIPWLTVETIELTGDLSVNVSLADEVILVMSLTKDLSQQVRALELIQQQVVYSGRSIERIDTRFDKAVVQYR